MYWELQERAGKIYDREHVVEKQDLDLRAREETLQLLLTKRVEGYAHVARAWADWEEARVEHEADYLTYKKHPAVKAAEIVREKGRELGECGDA